MPRKIKNQVNLPELEGDKEYSQPAKLKYSADSRRLKKQLADIYAEVKENENSAAARRMSRKVKILTFLVFILAFLAGVSWLGFFFFDGGKKFSEESVKLMVEGPSNVYAGEVVTYRLRYGNKGGLPLGGAALRARYPDGFELATTTQSGGGAREWEIGALAPGKEGGVEFTGRFLGAAGADMTMRIFFDYRPANFNADFQKITNFTVHVVPLPLSLILSGPEQMLGGESADFTLSVSNQSGAELKNLDVSFGFPVGFKAEQFSPAASGTQAIWPIASLPSGSTSTIAFKGSFTSEAQGGAQILKTFVNLRLGNNVLNQNVLEKKVVLSKAALALQLAVNGATDKQAINFGDKASFTVAYENIGQISLKNVTLRLVIDAPSVAQKSLFDWAAIEDRVAAAIKGQQLSDTVRRGIVSWNKAQVPALFEIKPGDKGSIEFSLPLKKSDALDIKRLVEFKTLVYAEALINQANEPRLSAIQSNNLNLILNSDLALSLQATFRETKNLPIQVGQRYDVKSLYTVTWTLTNSLHELTDLELSAILPENVDWENITSVSAGEISYDENLKQVVWKLNRMPSSYNKATVSFDVGLKAEGEDRGREAILIEKTRLQAKDKLTGEEILFWKDPVVTIL